MSNKSYLYEQTTYNVLEKLDNIRQLAEQGKSEAAASPTTTAQNLHFIFDRIVEEVKR